MALPDSRRGSCRLNTKAWQHTDIDQYPECGDDLVIYTDAKIGCYDGDPVRCVSCGFESGMSVDEDGNAWVQG